MSYSDKLKIVPNPTNPTFYVIIMIKNKSISSLKLKWIEAWHVKKKKKVKYSVEK